VLTTHEDEGYLREALKSGALGYIPEKATEVEHGLTVKTCLEGRSRRTQELANKAGIESVSN
jgi:DNA-binding NarL/FixJ family response regulator